VTHPDQVRCDDLQLRLDQAAAELAALRAEAVVRQAELRSLAAQLPERLSRRAVISGLVRDLRTTLLRPLRRTR
jgi:hypothetical protein